MNSIVIKAPAKINLLLDIVGMRLDNQFHLMQMVMQTVSLYDYLYLRLTNKKVIELFSEQNSVPLDKTNIAYRAAKAFFEYTNYELIGLAITIKKNIPVEAGLGGGSADGAGVLVGLNEIFEAGLSTNELMTIAENIGADIPFCLIGGTAFVEGIGEKVTRLADMPACHIVIAKPDEGTNTKLAFLAYDRVDTIKHPAVSKMIQAVELHNIKSISEGMSNVFEQSFVLESVIEIRKLMERYGALNAMMSGSGSAVFGIFTDISKAKRCYNRLLNHGYESYMCNPVTTGPIKEN